MWIMVMPENHLNTMGAPGLKIFSFYGNKQIPKGVHICQKLQNVYNDNSHEYIN